VSLSPILEFEKVFTMEFTSIFGIQSGFDSASVVQKLIALQARPIDLKLAQLDAKETQLEAFQSLRNELQTFQSALNATGSFNQFNVTSANFTVTAGAGSVLSATPSGTAVPGTHNITVNTLAQQGTVLSDTGYNATTDIIPMFNGATVTGHFVEVVGGGAITEIAISATPTVQDVVDAINASAADVTASIIDDGSAGNPLRIQIRGNQPGTANTVTSRIFHRHIDATEHLEESFSQTQAATDASVTVDGTTFIRTNNSINDIINGVTLNLESLGSGILTLSTDNAAITNNIRDFVDAFNKLVGFIDEQTVFNPETFATGTLFGNSSVQGLETSLRRIATGQVTGLAGNFAFLSQIGITTQDDGTLAIDEAKLSQALTTDLTNVVELFTSANGVVNQLNSKVSLLLDSSQQGPLKAELDSLTESIDDLNDTLLRMDERLELFEKKIRQEFINLEIILGRLDAQRNAFQQALQGLGSFSNQ
jgi:flagellar hook-associated protein 2